MRPLFAAPIAGVVAVASAMAQYSGFATNSDGSQIIVGTMYRQAGTRQTADPKVLRIEKGGVALAATQTCDPIRLIGACGIEDLEVSETGAVLYQSRFPCRSGGSSCILRETYTGTLLIGGSEPRQFAGRIRISRNGRFLVNHDLSGAPGGPRVSTLMDLASGSSVDLGANLRNHGTAMGVSDDGAVLMSGGWLVRAGERTKVPGPENGHAVGMDARGTVVLMQDSSLYAADVRSGRYWQMGPSDRLSYGGSISADGRWVLYLSDVGTTPQLFFSSIEGWPSRQLTAHADGVRSAVLSGDGRWAVALMRSGALLRIDTSSGVAEEVVGALPYEIRYVGSGCPGSLNVLEGQELAPDQATADGNWPEELGGVRLTIGDAVMRLSSVSATQIVYQVPYETAVGEEPLVIRRAGEHVLEASVAIRVAAVAPRVVAVMHEDFGAEVTWDRPARAGEVVHIFATGLGRVDPAPEGGAAARAEPLSRLANGWTFLWWETGGEGVPAEVPFAGLAPGFVGLYQVDVRVPERQRYELVFADQNGPSRLGFVTLAVAR